MPLNILIVGAGICGPALVCLLQGSEPKHNITVVERSTSLREAGQQIDLKGQGHPILRKMGLLDIVKSYCVDETGLELVDSKGKPRVRLGIDPDGQREVMALTSEYEIMRGDLVKVLYEASLKQRAKIEEDVGKVGALTYEFGKTITELTQSSNDVEVSFSDGQKTHYDLVVGADGQGSRTRQLIFGQEASDEAFKSLGIHAAYYSIPRVEGEDRLARAYLGLGNRAILTRTSNRPMTQVYLFAMKDMEELKKLKGEPLEKQKNVWGATFKEAGWESKRLVSGLSTCDDFYAHEIGQVKLKQIYNGRVALLGDAGYCPSPFTGMGTTVSLIGAYVLAGELARHGNDVDKALKAYEDIMQSPVDECQNLPLGSFTSRYPSSKLGMWVLHNAMWAISHFKIDRMVNRLLPKGKDGWVIPEYPELNLVS